MNDRSQAGDNHSTLLEDIVARFESAWQRGQPPAIENMLPADGPLRQRVLPELLLIDLEYRLKAGLSARVEEYRQRFSEIVQNHAAVVDLIVAEFRFRSRLEPTLTQREFLDRFPEYRHMLAGKLAAAQSASSDPHEQETADLAASMAGASASSTQRLDRSKLPNEISVLVDQFLELQLLTGAQMIELTPALVSLRSRDAFFNELQRRGWLTSYQVEQLRKNQIKQIIFGAYILLEPLGKGGMGAVFKARHRVMKRIVALKIIRKGHIPHGEAVQRFQQEVEAAAKLSHPNIVTSHDAGRAGDFHFFVMEHIEGAGLDELLKKQGPLPIPLACDLIRQTALGLQHAHDQGIVHRDIKPQNLILDARGTVKVLDMGLARIRYDPAGGGAKALTQMGAIMGTADYIAPEQIIDCSRVDGRADIYSLGCTFYKLLTGQPPFPGKDLRLKLEQHMRETPRPVETLRPEVPQRVAAILNKMLARQPGDRFATAGEVATALTPFCETAITAAPRQVIAVGESVAETLIEKPLDGLAQPGQQRMPSTLGPLFTRRRFVALGVGMLLGVALLAVFLWQRQQAVSPLGRLRHEDLPAVFRDDLPQEVVGVLGDDRVTHLKLIMAMAISRDGKLLATADDDTLRISDAKTLKKIRSIKTDRRFFALAFSPDGSKIAGGGPFSVWDVSTGKELWKNTLPADQVYSVAFTSDGERIVTAGSPGPIRLWSVSAGTIEKEIPDDYGNRVGATLSPDDSKVLVGGADKVIRLWDLQSGTVTKWKEEGRFLVFAAFSPDGGQAITGGDGYLLWDVAKGKKLHQFDSEAVGTGNSAFFTADGKRLVIVDSGGGIQRWEMASKQKLPIIRTGGPTGASVPADGGKRILIASFNTVRAFDAETGKEIQPTAPAPGGVNSVVFTPDGKQLLPPATASAARLARSDFGICCRVKKSTG